MDKKPPKTLLQSAQLELFGQFVSNDATGVSNAVEVWESIPKYFFTTSLSKKLRNPDGLAKPYKWSYIYNNIPYTVKIQPALVEQEDGTYKAFFPSITEELVEESLKKILADQNYGMHDPHNVETWVRFTQGMILRELKIRNRTRSRTEIKHAIEVMNKCIISLYKSEEEVWSGSILQDLVTVGRKDYEADTDAHHIARLPLFISRSINRLEYRQFNYNRLMGCDEQLTRWLYKRLINRFKHASLSNDYHCMYSDLKGSGLLQQSREVDNRRKVCSALDELVQHQVIIKYDTEEKRKGRSISDVKYTLYPAPNFISEQKAANKRSTDNYMIALEKGISVDK